MTLLSASSTHARKLAIPTSTVIITIAFIPILRTMILLFSATGMALTFAEAGTQADDKYD